jgi:hypothetical protein
MARPKKQNADYFPHDADMRNDPKIRALRRKYGIEGYAVWNMLLEILTDSEFFEFKLNRLNNELLAGDFDIDPEDLKKIICYCQEINLLVSEGEMIFTEKLKERFESVLNRRNRQRKTTKEELSPAITINEEEIVIEKPQSKVKERKVNTLSNEYEEKELLTDWGKCRKSYKNLPTNIIRLDTREKNLFKQTKQDFSREQFQKAMKGLFKQEQINYTSMITRPFHFLERVETYLNAFESNDFKLYGAKPIEQ